MEELITIWQKNMFWLDFIIGLLSLQSCEDYLLLEFNF